MFRDRPAAGGGQKKSAAGSKHAIQDENPYASYALQHMTSLSDNSMYDRIGNLTYTKDTSTGESVYTSLNRSKQAPGVSRSPRQKDLDKEEDSNRSRGGGGGGGKLHRTKAERLGETSSSSVTNKGKKGKVQFWDEGPIGRCVHDVVAKYIPDRTVNSTCFEPVDAFSDDDVTTESGSYVIDADDFRREKNVREAETLFVDYTVV